MSTDLPTPLEEAPPELANGRQLWLKREDLHEVGSFKWRGALPVLESYQARGASAVVTASTGNHGAATAWAAGRVGVRPIVFVPERASETKLALLHDLGADLREFGRDIDDAKDAAREYAEEQDLPFFEDGAEPAQYDGYEAIAREVVTQLGQRPGVMPVAVGNGALLIGVARGLGGPGAVGVVSKEAPVMAWSVRAGAPVPCDRSDTFADGMAVRVAVPVAVAGLVELGTPFVEVSDRKIAEGVGRFARAGIRVEGSPAAALAAIGQDHVTEEPVVLIVCGRNIDTDLHRRAVEDPGSFPD